MHQQRCFSLLFFFFFLAKSHTAETWNFYIFCFEGPTRHFLICARTRILRIFEKLGFQKISNPNRALVMGLGYGLYTIIYVLRICLGSHKTFFFYHNQTKVFAVPRRNIVAFMFSSCIFLQVGLNGIASAELSLVFREHIDTFDGYTFKYPKNWIQVRGAGADIFFRDPYVLDENISVELSSPSSSNYKSVEDLGSPQEAAEKVLRQYLVEFMSTRLGVRRESNILSTSSRIADDGRLYYQVEV